MVNFLCMLLPFLIAIMVGIRLWDHFFIKNQEFLGVLSIIVVLIIPILVGIFYLLQEEDSFTEMFFVIVSYMLCWSVGFDQIIYYLFGFSFSQHFGISMAFDQKPAWDLLIIILFVGLCSAFLTMYLNSIDTLKPKNVKKKQNDQEDIFPYENHNIKEGIDLSSIDSEDQNIQKEEKINSEKEDSSESNLTLILTILGGIVFILFVFGYNPFVD